MKQNNNFYNYYGNVYSKEESDGELGSPHSQQQVLLKQQQQQPQSQQHQPLPPPIAPQVLSNNDYLPTIHLVIKNSHILVWIRLMLPII